MREVKLAGVQFRLTLGSDGLEHFEVIHDPDQLAAAMRFSARLDDLIRNFEREFLGRLAEEEGRVSAA